MGKTCLSGTVFQSCEVLLTSVITDFHDENQSSISNTQDTNSVF